MSIPNNSYWLTAIICFLAASQTLDARELKSVATPDPTLSAALAAVPNENRGRAIFEKRCAQCHQNDAHGLGKQQVPALAGQQYAYLVKQLIDLVSFDRANNTMHEVLVKSGVSDIRSIADVAAYVANLPVNPSPDRGSGLAKSLGKTIFDGACISCHGKGADGNDDLWIPTLRGQHYEYLLKQMQMMADGSRNNVSEDLHRVFTMYAPQELDAVADYISRINDR
jgi:cytochrome c553